jgi:tryptophan 2,3-dioxygenase
MTETAYENYLHADKILSYQKKEGELICDGERDFQGVQQESEFIWTRINLMLKRTNEKIVSGNLYDASRLLEQAAALWSGLTAKIEELLWRLWPNDFLKIRKLLGPGSTADSPRYRESEQLGRSLWKPFEKQLRKSSLTVSQLLKMEDRHEAGTLMKAMMWYDYRVQEFNIAHIYLVLGEIGDKTVGLQGGTTDYLIKRQSQYLFPQLWDSINELYEEHTKK